MLKGFSVQQVLGAAGPANSVLYLNASGVLTGSASLTFDGTKFGAATPVLIGNQASTGATGTLRFIAAGGVNYIQSGENTTAASAAPLVFTNMNASGEWMRLNGTGLSIQTTLGVSALTVQSGAFGFALDIINDSSNVSRLRFCQNATTSSWTSILADGRNTGYMAFRTNDTERARITADGNIVAGGSAALGTTATDGFLYVPTCAGVPTGTPTAITGMAPIVVDTTNNRWYFYSGGAWRNAGP